jgi:hypothetical protein
MPIPGQDAGGIFPELKLKLKFYCSWTWCFFIVVFFLLFCLFVCYIIVGFYFYSNILFFLSVLSTSPSLSSHPSSHPLPSPSFSCATIHYSSSQLLFLSFLIHSLSLPSPPPSILPQPVTTLPIPPTHSPPADQPIPNLHNLTPCNPWHKHPTLQQQKYTQTHTRAT